MLTLNDGRSELWQWDTGRKLTVDADCTQVHFSNKVFGRSIDVDVVDGVASIPDILLQTDKDLNAWAFVGTPENGYTKISKTFKVNKRNKPADYVFTPPEQITLGELVERLEKIEESQDPDAIKNAVDDYLANNPIEIDETDPTVSEWAKQPTKPSYTASEIGALPADTVIPTIPDNVSAFRNDAGYLTEHQDISGKLDASALPTAINTALAQAKANGEFDGEDGATGPQGPKGDTGSAGKDGSNGVSATHSWNGTVLTITSASGTSSANLKGDKGDKGDPGETGPAGSDATVVVDSGLSSTSTNPVQNKAVTAKFNSLARRMSEVGWNGATDKVAYYEIGRMPAYNSGDNRGSVLLTGRLGHWIASSIANFSILLSNRSGCQASVFAQGNATGALNCCDIEVYRQTDDTDIIYIKTKGYWVFDLEYVANQVTMQYKNVQVTPTGTKVCTLSEEKRVSTDFQGAMTANEFKGKFTATEDPTTAMGVATKQYVDNQISTKVAEQEDLVSAVLNALPTWNGGSY